MNQWDPRNIFLNVLFSSSLSKSTKLPPGSDFAESRGNHVNCYDPELPAHEPELPAHVLCRDNGRLLQM